MSAFDQWTIGPTFYAALVVAEAMVPQLQALLEKTDPAQWAYPPGPRVRVEEKERAWLTWTLAKIEKALVKREEPVDWLRQWRERCGQVSVQGAAA